MNEMDILPFMNKEETAKKPDKTKAIMILLFIE